MTVRRSSLPRIAVTGIKGQVATALVECGAGDTEVIPLGRPHFDLADPASIARSIGEGKFDAVINAAAYTGVDRAEAEEDTAFAVNAEGAGAVSQAAAKMGIPILQLSTDYVFSGDLNRPYREDDPVGPMSAYGRTKLEGELQVANSNPNHVILRTAWVYSPYSANFVKTMLRLGENRQEVGVVADQIGNPTYAIDIAEATLAIAKRVISDTSLTLRGVFHLVGSGEASWADLAELVFIEAARRGRPPVRVKRITTADYPTAARRPANSRLDGTKLARTYGLIIPDWRISVADCVARLLPRA